MNSRQREILQVQLNDEKQVLKELQQVFKQVIKDCSTNISQLSARTDMENIQAIVYQQQYQNAIRAQLETALAQLQSGEYATISDYLTRCYQNGYMGVMYDLTGQGIPLIIPMDQQAVVKALQIDSKISKGLYNRLGEDVSVLKKNIRAEVSRGVSNGSSWNEIGEKISLGMNSTIDMFGFNKAKNNSIRIARTEGHRIQNQSAMDAQEAAKKKGADVLKQWCAALDGNTRPAHAQADGQIKEIDEYFIVGGEKIKAPGIGGSAANVCNCRCALLQRARWALDDKELDTLKERTEYFGLDKTKDFEDYKSKYLEVTIPKTSALIKDELRDYTVNEIKEIADSTYKIVNKYIENVSKWSGNIIVDNNGVEYGKLWNCDIKTTNNTAPHIILHEQLHAHSISYYDAQIYLQYRNIEEATVQLMAQEISKLEDIIIVESQYDDLTDALRQINSILNLYDNDFDFAKCLIEMPVTDRIEWLEEKTSNLMMKGGTVEEYQHLSNLIHTVS